MTSLMALHVTGVAKSFGTEVVLRDASFILIRQQDNQAHRPYGEIRWYVDGKNYQTQSFWWSSSKVEKGQGAKPSKESDLNAWPAPFNQPFYLVMNVAVGGKFLGNPDQTTGFPAEMLVDAARSIARRREIEPIIEEDTANV